MCKCPKHSAIRIDYQRRRDVLRGLATKLLDRSSQGIDLGSELVGLGLDLREGSARWLPCRPPSNGNGHQSQD